MRLLVGRNSRGTTKSAMRTVGIVFIAASKAEGSKRDIQVGVKRGRRHHDTRLWLLRGSTGSSGCTDRARASWGTRRAYGASNGLAQ